MPRSEAGTKRVVLPYAPRPQLVHLHEQARRFNVWIVHRRGGKTVLSLNDVIRAVATCPRPRPRGAYIAPLYKQAKRVAWDYAKEYTRTIPGMKYSESELTARFPNGAQLALYGADNPDSLRGEYFDAVVLDEVAQMPPSLWDEVLRPALADREGSAIFIGTPAGRLNKLYELFEYAASGQDPEWSSAFLTADDTGIIPEKELASARRGMSKARFQQEFYCSWDANIRGSYYGELLDEAERQGRITEACVYDPQLPVITSWDLGVLDPTVVVHWQVSPMQVRCIGVDAFQGTGLPEVYAYLRANRPYSFASHIGPHDLKVREVGSAGATARVEAGAAHGWQWTICPNWPLDEGIEATKQLLARAYFHPVHCKVLLEALRLYRSEYDEARGVHKLKPVHDWCSDYADAVRMFAVQQAGAMAPQADLWAQDDAALAQYRRELARQAI